ncbi:MAG: FtsK/SpoIIIE domain-containing protein [Hyphomicrobiaceae bacterium]
MLAADLIATLGPCPKRSRFSSRRRWQLRRLQRAIRRLRTDLNFYRRLARLQQMKDDRLMQWMLNMPTGMRLDRLTPEHLIAIEHGTDEVRKNFAKRYNDLLKALRPSVRSVPPLDAAGLTPASRLLFLPVLISAGNRWQFDRLNIDQSSPTRSRYVYTANGTAIDESAWQTALPTINSLCGGTWRVSPIDGISIAIEALPEIPASFPFEASYLRRDALFLGLDLATGKPWHMQFDRFCHTLAVGSTGTGKSTLLQQIATQVLTGQLAVERTYIVDLKFGLEFSLYAEAEGPLQVIDSFHQLPDFLAAINEIFLARIELMKAARRHQWDGPPILVIIDEFAQIMTEDVSKEERKAVLDGFTRLGNQARATGIFLWIQVQHAVADTLPTAIRRNLTTTISFCQQSPQAAAQIFGDTQDFPTDITRLRRGQFLLRDGRTSEFVGLQAALVTPGTAIGAQATSTSSQEI